MCGVRCHQVRITAEVSIRKGIMPEWIGILSAKPMTPIVAISSKLGGSGFRFEFPGIGTETKIAAAKGNLPAGEVRFNPGFRTITPVMTTHGAVDPVVQTPAESVDAKLLVALEEAAKERL